MNPRIQPDPTAPEPHAQHPHTNPVSFIARYPVECLTALCLVFVLQTGLMPFDFVLGTSLSTTEPFTQGVVGSFTRPDIASNVFLYVPVGLLIYWSLRRARRRRFGAVPLTLCAVVALSAMIEWVQAYAPSRVSCWRDLAANAVGGGLGVLLGMATCHMVPVVVGHGLTEARERPLTTTTKAYICLLVVAASMPFSFAFDASRFKQVVMESHLVPFASDAHYAQAVRSAEAKGDERSAALASWSRMRGWSRWTAECLSFLLLTWLLRRMLVVEYGFRPPGMLAMLLWISLSLALALSVVQLPILSRGLDGTDVLFRLVGIVLGFVTYAVSPMASPAQQGGGETGGRLWTRLAGVTAALTMAMIVYHGIIPLRFDAVTSTQRASNAVTELAPLGAYFHTRFDIALGDAIEKACVYALLTGLLCVSWRRLHNQSTRGRILRLMPIMVGVSVVLEVVQIFEPVRVSGITDPVLAMAGCAIGLIVYQQVVLFQRLVLNPQTKRVIDGRGRFTRRMSLTDEVIASLAEPYPEAPVEVVPTKPAPVEPTAGE